ncbi:MAG: CTP synthase [Tissierellia bacterium]|nr:CTP synthase [Tissierellia bacterium]
MNTKYIFVTGGVVSSLGKGITAASLGRLLKNRGLKVLLQKFDPYLNVDPGNMSPLQHGEVFVTDDGAETDLDIGHYERFVDVRLNRHSDITTGMVYRSVLNKERDGFFEGGTVQVIPHITNEIKDRVRKVASEQEVDIVITEIGGTVGDIEGLPFLEAIRQIKKDLGRENVMYIHVTLLPYLTKSEELKTKPTQHSVKELRSIGIQPDLLIIRTEHEIDEASKEKIALFCDLEPEEVIENNDADSIYEIPLMLEKQGLSDLVVNHLGIDAPPVELAEWKKLVERIKQINDEVKISMVVKYIDLKDAYISLVEALKHSGIANDVNIDFNWIDAEMIEEDNYEEILDGSDAVLIPAGFGDRGLKGMILASKYSREKGLPFLGISMGMHAAILDIMRNKAGMEITSEKCISSGYDDVIHAPREDNEKDDRRLGLMPCKTMDGSKAREIYGNELIYERHRNKYEFNLKYLDKLVENGAIASGFTPDEKYLQIFELKDHDWFMGVQFHPEFVSRPDKPHPLITDFVLKAKKFKENK